MTEELITRILQQQKTNKERYVRERLPMLFNSNTKPKTLGVIDWIKQKLRKQNDTIIPHIHLRIAYSIIFWNWCEDPYNCLIQLGVNPDDYEMPKLYKLVAEEYMKQKNTTRTREFLTLTNWKSGEPIYLDPSTIVMIRQIAADDVGTRRTSITVKVGSQFIVKEEAAWIFRYINPE